MKTREKILLAILAILLIVWAILAWIFISEENKVKEYSTYCMDRVRHELWEQLENIYMTDAFCSEWICIYIWGVTYGWVDYAYACKVYNKENVEFGIEPLYPEEDTPNAKMRVVEWQTEEETQAMVEEACGNMWWTWADGSCMLEDGSYVNF
jgi:hypothetical protein